MVEILAVNKPVQSVTHFYVFYVKISLLNIQILWPHSCFRAVHKLNFNIFLHM
jgi:hypothetical protein